MSISPSSTEDGMVLATFRLPRAVDAETVFVVGDFNDWSQTTHPMQAAEDGFVAHVPLEPGRRHRFRYLLDGERWENDWSADDYVTNEYGGTDSVLDLTSMENRAEATPIEPAVPLVEATTRDEPAPRRPSKDRSTKARRKRSGDDG
jgi:1,4-alpha-glucan branching enzyme